MSTDLAAILVGVVYLSALVAMAWAMAWRTVEVDPMDDLRMGDRVQQRSAWRDEPLKHGTIVEIYGAAPSGISNGVTLYAVLWDGGFTAQRGHMRVGLEREHQE